MLEEAKAWDRQQTASIEQPSVVEWFGKKYRNGKLIK